MKILSATTLDQFGHSQSPYVTERYKIADSRIIADTLSQYGWQLQGLSAARVRKSKDGNPYTLNKDGYQKHLMFFEKQGVELDHGNRMTIVVRNSYDTNTSVNLFSGIYRLVCANGLIVGDTLVPGESIKHVGESFWYELLTAIGNIAAKTENCTEQLKRMQNKIVNQTDAHFLNHAATALRTEKQFVGSSPRRVEDLKNDLYTTYNRLQEDLIKGGITVRDKDGQLSKMRALNAPDEIVRVNTELFNLCYQMVA